MDPYEALLDIAWNNLNEMFQRFQRVDSKILGIITVCGILNSLLLGLTKNEVTKGNLNATTTAISLNNGVNGILFTFAGIGFIFTILISLYVLRPRKMKDISTKELYKNIKTSKEISAKEIRILLLEIEKVEDIWRKESNNKTKEFRYALACLALSIIFLILSIITPIIVTNF